MRRWAWVRRITERIDNARSMGLTFGWNEHGERIMLDTEPNWRDFTDRTDREVAHEVDFRGPNELPFNRPPGMPAEQADWNRWWLDMFERHKRHQENPERYIAYMMQARRTAGLPELIPREEQPP